MLETKSLTLPAETSQTDFKTGSVFFIGTATVILRYAGFTILTDPNFLHKHDKVPLGYGLHSERVTEPALDIDDLPPFDFVILSHLHGDHFDQLVSEKLPKNTLIITNKASAAGLQKMGFTNTQSLEMWENISFTKGAATLRVTSMPGKHAPGILSAMLPPVMGSMLEFLTPAAKTALRLYISGDTLMHERLQEIPLRYPDIDLALLHLGGTRIMGLMLTMDAKQGVAAIKLIKPKKAIPIHYNDYTVFKSPLDDFKAAAKAANLEDRIIYLYHGDTYNFEVPNN